MSARPFIMLAVGTISAAMLGCRDGLSPAEVPGMYVLARVGDAPVPAVIFRDVQGTVRLIADTLSLGANGRGTFVRISAIELAGDAPALPPTRSEIGVTYRVTRTRVQVFYVCPINASCTAGPHLSGRPYGDGMLVEESMLPETTHYYRRVDRFLER